MCLEFHGSFSEEAAQQLTSHLHFAFMSQPEQLEGRRCDSCSPTMKLWVAYLASNFDLSKENPLSESFA